MYTANTPPMPHSHTIDLSIEYPQWNKQNDDWEDFFQTILIKIVDILHLDHTYTLSILLTENETIRTINHDFRGKDKPTNVLSFPSGAIEKSPDGTVFLGDVAFAYGVVTEESLNEDKTFLNHMTHLTIHGILHLLGYDHETDTEAEEMESLEIHILEHFNIRNPYTPL